MNDDLSGGRSENLASALDAVEFVEGDLADPAQITTAVRGIEVAFHQGALLSVPRSLGEPLRTHRVKVDGTLGLLEAAQKSTVRRIVLASSSSALPVHEAPRPSDIRNSLSDSKKAVDLLGNEARVAIEEGLKRTLDAIVAAETPLASLAR